MKWRCWSSAWANTSRSGRAAIPPRPRRSDVAAQHWNDAAPGRGGWPLWTAAPGAHPRPGQSWDRPREGSEWHEWVDDTPGPIVRPYAMVRGRTRARHDVFDLVAFVVAMADSLNEWTGAQPEHLTILGLCRTPRSVAEVISYMNLPMGVVRVLLGDLLDLAAIQVGSPADPGTQPSLQVVKEVLDGLRAL
ncbi:DUF742 domain-containing protein [Streptomyces sp. NPDC093228]|uniref:DUF742 domain-containing protein n=1 Tax=Streptomyces sp. NPDC093228 TaxID=3155070 RepID=UPI0034299F60